MLLEPLPPVADPKHAELIAEMQEAIDRYAGILAEHLVPVEGGTVEIPPSAYIEAQQKFMSDQYLQLMLRELALMRVMFERPRYLIRNTEDSECKK